MFITILVKLCAQPGTKTRKHWDSLNSVRTFVLKNGTTRKTLPGKPEKVLFDEVQKRFKLALGMRGRREVDSFADSFRIWRVNELIAFDGMVIGFDKQSFTRTDRDFSFSISLRSCPYKEQVQFVRENKNKLVAYAKAKVQEYYKFKRHIGNIMVPLSRPPTKKTT